MKAINLLKSKFCSHSRYSYRLELIVEIIQKFGNIMELNTSSNQENNQSSDSKVALITGITGQVENFIFLNNFWLKF